MLEALTTALMRLCEERARRRRDRCARMASVWTSRYYVEFDREERFRALPRG